MEKNMFQTTNQIPKKNPSSSTELPHASGRVPERRKRGHRSQKNQGFTMENPVSPVF
jgi:hypothetical protein